MIFSGLVTTVSVDVFCFIFSDSTFHFGVDPSCYTSDSKYVADSWLLVASVTENQDVEQALASAEKYQKSITLQCFSPTRHSVRLEQFSASHFPRLQSITLTRCRVLTEFSKDSYLIHPRLSELHFEEVEFGPTCLNALCTAFPQCRKWKFTKCESISMPIQLIVTAISLDLEGTILFFPPQVGLFFLHLSKQAMP